MVIRLADWGLANPGEASFVSIGLLKGKSPVPKLAVYDLRKQAPTRNKPDSVIWRSAAPMLEDGAYVLSHFNAGNYNRLGGTFSAFEKAPSSANVDLRAGKGLHVKWNRMQEGFAGAWMHLYDDRVRPQERTYLHTGAAAFLYFEIRGIKGGEALTLRVADRVWDEKGDSLPIGDISLYLPGGRITREWQAARVPLSALPKGIEHEELATLLWSAEVPGSGEVHIRNLALVESAETVPPAGSNRKATGRALTRTLWVWRTENIVADAGELDALLALCASEGITDVFLQLLPPKTGKRRQASDLAAMLPMVETLHKHGVRVQALDGAPEFALAKHHPEVLSTVQAVIRSNKRNKRVMRFDGLRFDNEPYLLPGFAGPEKEAILRAYLDVLDKAHVLTTRAGLPLGADIPFWFDGHDRFQEPIALLDGRPVSELVMDRVENIAIMAYRTKVYGPDGVIAHCLDELEYAELTGKEVMIALESVYLPDETLQEFSSESGAGDRLLLRPEGRDSLRVTWFSATKQAEAESLVASTPGARLLHLRFEAHAPADKLSFHGPGRGAMNDAMDRIAEELSGHDALKGFALHAFDSLRKLQ